MPRIVHGQLTASQVLEVTLDADYETVEVMSRDGAAEIYGRIGQSDVADPTVGGDDCFVLPALPSFLLVEVPGHGATVVKLISSGEPLFSISGVTQ